MNFKSLLFLQINVSENSETEETSLAGKDARLSQLGDL